MSYTLSTNQNNSSGATTKEITLPATNFADWAIDVEGVDTLTIANSLDNLDTPETMKFTIQNVRNIYKNSDVPHTSDMPTNGIRMVSSIHGVWSEADSADTTKATHYAPVACSISLTVPRWASVTSSAVLALIYRALSGYFETTDSGSSNKRIEKMLRGIERPSGIN